MHDAGRDAACVGQAFLEKCAAHLADEKDIRVGKWKAGEVRQPPPHHPAHPTRSTLLRR